jgi:hypothetical protein
MKTATWSALLLVLLSPSVRAQSSDDGGAADMTAPTCMTDRDCAATPGTPFCCTGSSSGTCGMQSGTCVSCVDFAGNLCIPLACDGALCDSTNGSTCAVAGGVGARRSPPWPIVPAVVAGVVMLALARRRRRRHAGAALVLGALLASARPAVAAPEPPVDVTLRLPPPPRRVVSVAWNPFALIIGKASLELVVTPREHHALVLNPFYVWTTTQPIVITDDMGHMTQLATQSFTGWGGELGYRYYFGKGGPRGLFLGPSLILGGFSVRAGNGTQTQFLQYGGAVDVGYQLLVAERISLSLGGGVEVVGTDKAIPSQQLPARLYANFGVWPRLLASFGVAF